MNFDHSTTMDEQALARLMRWLSDSAYHHITITPLSHAQVNARPDNAWARNFAAQDVSTLAAYAPSAACQADHRLAISTAALQGLQDIFGWSRPFRQQAIPALLFDYLQHAQLITPHGDGWRSNIRLSSLDGYLYAHSAFPTTAEDAVFFGPDTYRYVHEISNELSARSHTVRRAADIGSGAGPGGITMARYHPQAEVLALDINQQALALTAVNAGVGGISNLTPVLSNLLTAVTGHFDLIAANPPYLVDKEQRAYRHGGGALGAGLSLAIIDSALPRLAPGGTLLLYTGVAIVDGVDVFRVEAEKRLQASPHLARLSWTYREIDPDVFGEELLNPCYESTDRIAAVILKVTLQA